MAYTLRSIIGNIKFELILLFRYNQLYNKWIQHEKVSDWNKKGWLTRKELKKQLIKWERFGKPVPPPHLLKQYTITEYQKKYQPALFIETGTFRGDMLEAQKGNFEKLYSIELSEKLWEAAKERFRNEPQIQLLQGDSGSVMKELCPRISEQALFWLDAHYSAGVTAMGDKESPILEELATIFAAQKDFQHVILIDDARLFVGKNDYPTLEELRDFVSKKAPGMEVEVEDDLIRITPGS